MRRFLALVGTALVGYALLPSLAHAQAVIIPNGRIYTAPPPVVVVQPATTYYVTPAPPTITTYSNRYGTTYSFYPSTTTYAVPAPVVTYAPPPSVIVPAAGYYEARTTYGYGILRPRGYSTQVYYHP